MCSKANKNYLISYLPVREMASDSSFNFIDGERLINISQNEFSFFEMEKLHISELLEIEVNHNGNHILSFEGRVNKIEEIEHNYKYFVNLLIIDKDCKKLLDFVNCFNDTEL